MVSLDKVTRSKRNRWEISFSLSAENPGLKSQASRSYILRRDEEHGTFQFHGSRGEKGSNREARGPEAARPSLLLQSLNRTECSYSSIFEKIKFQIPIVLILWDK